MYYATTSMLAIAIAGKVISRATRVGFHMLYEYHKIMILTLTTELLRIAQSVAAI